MAKKQGRGKIQSVLSLECIEANAAGIDVGATEIYVAVPAGRDPRPVRSFETFTEDLHRMAAWLLECKVTTVAMESTGVYWIPVFQILESKGIRVCLVNSRHVKYVPGRKSDVQDCQWLQYLHSVGLLQASFRPEDAICVIRSILRHRSSLVEMAAAHVQHMHKALTQMNLQIHHVLSDITGKSGLAIVEAIVGGERDPQKLAQLRDGRVQATEATIQKSLVGDYRREHLFTLHQSLQAYRSYQELIAACDQEIEEHLRQLDSKSDGDNPPLPTPKHKHKPRKNEFRFDLRTHLYRILGVDLTAIPGIDASTAHTLLAEVGTDLSKFPNVSAFVSWLGLCPNNKKSGGKILSRKTRKTNSRANAALRVAAQTLHRSQSFLGVFYRRMRTRLGGPKAITAAAHKLARVIFHLLTTGKAYDESIFAAEEQRLAQRREKRLRYQANALGFELVRTRAS